MELTQVAPDVYACLQPDRGLGWSNSGLVDRGHGLVVDTFWDLPRTRQAMDLYATVRSDVPAQLVNTHHNGDHCWGNQLYAEAGTEIIGHRLCAEHMGSDVAPELLSALAAADDPPREWRFLVDALRDTFDFTGVELTPPTTLVEDELTLDLDGLEVRVVYVGPAHTAGDVIIHLPDPGVVFTGDILFHNCTPIGWEGTNAKWVEALEHIAALDPAVVVPGHGPLATTDGVLALRDYLVFVHAEARRHFDAGHTSLEASLAIEVGPPFAGWTEPERLAMNVERSYREFRGGSWDESVDLSVVAPIVTALRDRRLAT